jgi:cytochrome c
MTPATEEAAMLKPFLVLSAVVLSVIALGPISALSAAQDANPVKPTAASQEKAKKLYGEDCSMCHGDNGSGKTDLAKDMQLTMMDWADAKTLPGMSDKQIFEAIRKGKGKMPAEDPARAKDDDVWNLVIYIRALAKSQPAPAAPATPAAAPAATAPAAAAPATPQAK